MSIRVIYIHLKNSMAYDKPWSEVADLGKKTNKSEKLEELKIE
jgi:hypothetical protein